MRHYSFIMMAIVALLTVACSGEKKEATETIATVKIDTVKVCGGDKVLQFPGRVVVSSDANLSFKVAGTLRRVYVEEGDRVKKGQLLAELDDTDYKVQLSATQAEYAHIKADAERVIALYNEGSTTASNYDKARYGLQQIEAKLNNHKNQLAYTKIYAPCDGSVQRCFFSTNETVGAGMPVVGLLTSGASEVEVNLPASSYVNRSKFARFTCVLDVMPDEIVDLDLINILPQANANQLYTMRLKFRSTDSRIAPGMSTWVNIETRDSLSAQVIVPTTGLLYDKEKTYIFTYNTQTSTVKRTPVVVEKLHTDGTAIVTGAVHDRDLIVSSGVHHITDGAKVRKLESASKTNVGGLL